MKKRLELVPGIRFPKEDEFPEGYDVKKLRTDFDAAQIYPGFKIVTPPDTQPFQFYAECNIDAPKVWNLFIALAELLPDEALGIVALRDEEPGISTPATKQVMLEMFQKYAPELASDPYLEFGIMSESEDPFSEVYVKASKYVQFWGNDLTRFKAVMQHFGLEENQTIRFVDEFPLVSESLTAPAKNPSLVFEELNSQFDLEES